MKLGCMTTKDCSILGYDTYYGDQYFYEIVDSSDSKYNDLDFWAPNMPGVDFIFCKEKM